VEVKKSSSGCMSATVRLYPFNTGRAKLFHGVDKLCLNICYPFTYPKANGYKFEIYVDDVRTVFITRTVYGRFSLDWCFSLEEVGLTLGTHKVSVKATIYAERDGRVVEYNVSDEKVYDVIEIEDYIAQYRIRCRL